MSKEGRTLVLQQGTCVVEQRVLCEDGRDLILRWAGGFVGLAGGEDLGQALWLLAGGARSALGLVGRRAPLAHSAEAAWPAAQGRVNSRVRQTILRPLQLPHSRTSLLHRHLSPSHSHLASSARPPGGRRTATTRRRFMRRCARPAAASAAAERAAEWSGGRRRWSGTSRGWPSLTAAPTPLGLWHSVSALHCAQRDSKGTQMQWGPVHAASTDGVPRLRPAGAGAQPCRPPSFAASSCPAAKRAQLHVPQPGTAAAPRCCLLQAVPRPAHLSWRRCNGKMAVKSG